MILFTVNIGCFIQAIYKGTLMNIANWRH